MTLAQLTFSSSLTTFLLLGKAPLIGSLALLLRRVCVIEMLAVGNFVYPIIEIWHDCPRYGSETQSKSTQIPANCVELCRIPCSSSNYFEYHQISVNLLLCCVVCADVSTRHMSVLGLCISYKAGRCLRRDARGIARRNFEVQARLP